jgi:hypothetical protein
LISIIICIIIVICAPLKSFLPHTGGLAADGYAPPGMTPDYGAAPPGYAGTTRLFIYLYLFIYFYIL